MSIFNFKKINKSTQFYRGLIIKGYTYFKSDFHNREKGDEVHLGEQKLRVGVILDVYDNNYFLVQFENKKAKQVNKFLKDKYVNVIKFINSDFSIVGSNSFCMILEKNKIKEYYSKYTRLKLNNIKLSAKKTNVIKKIRENKFSSWNKKKINNVLKNKQFVFEENQFTNENALKKLEIIWDRHNKNNPVPNENKEILETYDAINWDLVNSDERYEFYNVNNRSYRSDKTYLQIGYEVAKEYDLKLPKSKDILDKPKTYVDQQIKELEDIANELMLNPKEVVKIKNNDQLYQYNKHEETKENLMESKIIKKEPNSRER